MPDTPRRCRCALMAQIGGYCYRSLCPEKRLRAEAQRAEAAERAIAEAWLADELRAYREGVDAAPDGPSGNPDTNEA